MKRRNGEATFHEKQLRFGCSFGILSHISLRINRNRLTAYVSSGDVFVYFLVPRASCLGTPIPEAPASDRLK